MQEGKEVNKIIFLLIIAFLVISCGEKKEEKPKSDLELKMNSIAEGYVKLVLERR